MDHKIKININILSLDRLFPNGLGLYADKARAIEEAGVDGIVMPDHVVFGKGAVYPFGGWAVDPSETWPEPMAVLATAAGATRTVELITNVMVAPLRSAPLLAKQAATLYGLSNGRFQLGVGTGWQHQEYEANGQSFAGRSDVLFDQMRACRSLWHEQPASFHSKTVNFDDVWCSPGLPGDKANSPLKLWFGLAPVAANARFFAEFPDAGWSCIHPDTQFIADGRAALQAALYEQFGIRREIAVRAAPPLTTDSAGNPCLDRTIENLPRAVAAGVTEFDFPLMFYCREAAGFDSFIRKLGKIDRTVAA
jgi:alkanesulfonate monooxygenase SsuD/methylene tetrahydromethanopterin reductase-like flavin-dependent oxidoreductase (luciferase family)